MFRTMSVTSSRTPGIDENSCRTPSIWIEVTAAPKGGQQHAAQRVAESETKAALKRFGNHGRDPLRIIARLDVELVRLNQLLPILLDHVL